MSTHRYFIYARKSTESEDRQVRSIGDQLAELRELAKHQQCRVIEELFESQTAKAPGRPIFNTMLDRIERGEADGILAWHPDRLARNSVDGGRIIWLLDTGKVKDLKFPTVPFDTSSVGKFMLAILFGQSKYYVDNLSENIRRGQRQKLKNGIWPQHAPLGYLNDRTTRTIVPDPERALLVRRCFELYALGDYTLDRLSATMADMGLRSRTGTPLSRAQFHRLLRNPIYYGVIRYTKDIYEGQHEPLISKTLFEQVQRVVRERSKPRGRVLKPYQYRKFCRCGECGGMITTETQKGHNYLRCTKKFGPCSQPFMREESMTAEVSAALGRLAVPVSLTDWLASELAEECEETRETLEERRGGLEKKIAAIDAKLQKLSTTYFDEDISKEEYRELRSTFLGEKIELKERLAKLDTKMPNWLEPASRFVNVLSDLRLLTASDNEAEKVVFLKKTGSNLTIRDRRLHVEFKEPWEILEKHGRFARPNVAHAACAPTCSGKPGHVVSKAERAGFEPAVQV
jgi:site-specific DNA recombinase